MKNKINVHFLVPGSGPEPQQSLRSCLNGAEKFVRKDHVPACGEQDYWAVLSKLFHIHGAPSFPAAAFLAVADNQAEDFLCISPVHLEVGVEKIFLSAFCDLQVTTQEA
ncbi:MAG: hypothetical protein R3356_07835, partial [Eudoraea sp.]|nr:hypothetical protein [Eudoraea sp.]